MNGRQAAGNANAVRPTAAMGRNGTGDEAVRTSRPPPRRPVGDGMVPKTGVEPIRGVSPTRPSTWRVCQFRHFGNHCILRNIIHAHLLLCKKNQEGG